MKRLLDVRLKGSYTVEASLVVPICMFICAAGIILCYEIFEEAIHTVSAYEKYDAVQSYRLKETLTGGLFDEYLVQETEQ